MDGSLRISCSTISKVIVEVCSSINEVLGPVFLKLPDSEAEWLDISDGCNNKWQFPFAIGSVDGMHVEIKAPPHSGSDFFNYKGEISSDVIHKKSREKVRTFASIRIRY